MRSSRRHSIVSSICRWSDLSAAVAWESVICAGEADDNTRVGVSHKQLPSHPIDSQLLIGGLNGTVRISGAAI